jgi:DNA-binding response OmpR family regulator
MLKKSAKGRTMKARTKTMKLLVIEDERALNKAFEDKFARAGYEVKVAFDGEEGLALVKSFAPDAIVLDLVMPKKDGFEVLRELQSDSALSMIPVVVVSNLGEDGDLKRALALGAKDYYVKSEHPINEIVEKVKDAIASSR